MTNSLRAVVILAVLGTFSAARAETVYVAERMYIGLRAEATETSPVVKTVESGAPLEVLQRLDRSVQVRDRQGAEGWIEARYLTTDVPARLQLAKLQEDLAKSRTQTAEAQAQLKKAQALLAEQTTTLKELEKNASDKVAMPPTLPPVPVVSPSPAVKSPAESGFRFSFVWLAISFAMLGIGFAAGMLWLRESIRRRSGGMYLRI